MLLPLGVLGSQSGMYVLQERYVLLGYFLLLLGVLGSQSGKYAGRKSWGAAEFGGGFRV